MTFLKLAAETFLLFIASVLNLTTSCQLIDKAKTKWVQNATNSEGIVLLPVELAKDADITEEFATAAVAPELTVMGKLGFCIFERTGERSIKRLITLNPVSSMFFFRMIREEPETAPLLKDFDAVVNRVKTELSPQVDQILASGSVQNSSKSSANQSAAQPLGAPSPARVRPSAAPGYTWQEIAVGVGAGATADVSASLLLCRKISNPFQEGICYVGATVIGFIAGSEVSELLRRKRLSDEGQAKANTVSSYESSGGREDPQMDQTVQQISQVLSESTAKIMSSFIETALNAKKNPIVLSGEKYQSFVGKLEESGRSERFKAKDGQKCETRQVEAQAKVQASN